MLAVSPFESHHDRRLFGTDANDFNPLRPDMQLDTDASAVVKDGDKASTSAADIAGMAGLAGMSFGGGRWRCKMSITWLLLLLCEITCFFPNVVCGDHALAMRLQMSRPAVR